MIVLKRIYCWIYNRLRRGTNKSMVIVGKKVSGGSLLYKKKDGFYYPTNE